jgi:hypothetical protein
MIYLVLHYTLHIPLAYTPARQRDMIYLVLHYTLHIPLAYTPARQRDMIYLVLHYTLHIPLAYTAGIAFAGLDSSAAPSKDVVSICELYTVCGISLKLRFLSLKLRFLSIKLRFLGQLHAPLPVRCTLCTQGESYREGCTRSLHM